MRPTDRNFYTWSAWDNTIPRNTFFLRCVPHSTQREKLCQRATLVLSSSFITWKQVSETLPPEKGDAAMPGFAADLWCPKPGVFRRARRCCASH